MPKTDLEIVKLQGIDAMIKCEAVAEYMKENPFAITFNTALTMFYLGYINGKRAERSKKRGA